MRALPVVVAVLLAFTACSSDDESDASPDTTESIAAPTSTSMSAPTTIDDGPDAAPVADVCGLFDAALRESGLIAEGAPEQQLTPTADGCEWGLVTLVLRSDVDSAAFEEAVATLPGDPTTVDGLGEMAVSDDSLVVTYDSGHLVTVTGHEVMGDEQLVPLARAVLSRL